MTHALVSNTPWFPPEWAAQQCILLTWPHDQGDWGANLQDVEGSFIAMARAVAARQRLLVICRDGPHLAHVQALLQDLAAVDFTIAASNDIWVRDHGPISVVRDGRLELLDFVFNGWGGKYPAALDNQVTRKLLASGALPEADCKAVDAVLEGGSLETDGQGTLLTTSRCLLDPNRNGVVDREQVTGWMQDWLGCHRVLWLDHGYLEGDDTDSHVDMLARFAPGDQILFTACDDPDDVHYPALTAMAEQLAGFRTETGRPYQLTALPWPPATTDSSGERLPLSYANFLIINGAVLVPVYGVPTDQAAMALIAAAFPGREISGIPAMPLIRQRGSLHCASMQVPLVSAG